MSNIIPLQFTEYKHKRWQKPQSMLFAAQDSYCPLSVTEISQGAAGITIVFIRQGEDFLLSALQGFNPGQNLLVNEKGQWLGAYCPNHYSLYPFCLAEHGDSKVICERSGSGLISDSVDGNQLFESTGEKTPEFEALIQQLVQHQSGLEHTARLAKEIVELDLLSEWSIEFDNKGQKSSLKGVYRIDEKKLNALSFSQFGGLRDSGALRICYCQLVSMFNIRVLSRLNSIKNEAANLIGDSLDFDSGGSLNFDNL